MDKFPNLGEKTSQWVQTHYLQLGIFNALLVILVLLRSAGYFDPYLPISVNLIVVTALILSIFLLSAKSGSMFVIFCVFWIFAAMLKMLHIDIWAERTGMYAFQSLAIGIGLFFYEALIKRH